MIRVGMCLEKDPVSACGDCRERQRWYELARTATRATFAESWALH